jgi:hypothetical protein
MLFPKRTPLFLAHRVMLSMLTLPMMVAFPFAAFSEEATDCCGSPSPMRDACSKQPWQKDCLVPQEGALVMAPLNLGVLSAETVDTVYDSATEKKYAQLIAMMEKGLAQEAGAYPNELPILRIKLAKQLALRGDYEAARNSVLKAMYESKNIRNRELMRQFKTEFINFAELMGILSKGRTRK